MIDSIYFTLRYILSDIEYLRERVILVVVNINIRRINNNFINRLMSDVYLKYSNRNNTQSRLIDSIYLILRYILFNIEYLRERVILVVVNIGVRRISNNYINRLMNNIYLKYSNNILVDSKIREKYNDECFHNYNEISLSFYILRLKIDISIMIIRNLKLFVMCINIRARFIHVDRNVLKTKVIDEKYVNIKILISRISLQSKDNESNKKRRRNVLCFFIK